MDEDKKKKIMMIVVIACLVLAGGITYLTQSDGMDSGLDELKGQMIWVKCGNPDCGTTYEMDKKEFYEFIQANMNLDNPMASAPPLPCNKCGKKSIYQAVKCEKCGEIFFANAKANDYSDRCTKCGYSHTEETRKRP